MYMIRDWDSNNPAQGTVVAQGSNSTVNLVSILPRLEEAGVNVRVIAVVSEELFDLQPQAYRESLLPEKSLYDLMVVSTGTRRIHPARNLGPLTDEYSLSSDWDNQWLTGGNEADVIAEAHLDPDSIYAGIKRFADDHQTRMERQRRAVGSN
jgi:transketolase